MLDVLIWNKYSRVIMRLSEILKISPLKALDLFYNSPLFPFLTDKEWPLITMSDAWICDEVLRCLPSYERGKGNEVSK